MIKKENLMFKFLKRLFFKSKKVIVDQKFVTYQEADLFLREGYVLAKEEDYNKVVGMVYLVKYKE